MRKILLLALMAVFSTGQLISQYILYDEIQARSQLLNKTVYLLTKDCHVKNGTDVEFGKTSQKFIPVVITDLKQVSKKQIEIYVRTATGINYLYKVILYKKNNELNESWGLDLKNIFSFDNPKILYPNISDIIWENIKNEQVQIGMSKQECTLSWGEPKTINKTTTINNIHEQWVYKSDSYLYFDNGFLTAIQN